MAGSMDKAGSELWKEMDQWRNGNRIKGIAARFGESGGLEAHWRNERRLAVKLKKRAGASPFFI
ncbi:hypothetical protein D3C76_1783570 [compost metagenome]